MQWRKHLVASAGLLALALVGCSSENTASDSSSSTGIMDGGLGPLLDAGAPGFSDLGRLTKVSDKFWFTEGPVWDPAKSVLYFTDINVPMSDGGIGAIYTLTLPDKINVLAQPTGGADGLALDTQKNLVVAGYGSRSLWLLHGPDQVTTLAPCLNDGGSCYAGQTINTPDDVAVRSDGTLYFTDPTFGQNLSTGAFALSGAQGVYRLTQDGVLHLEDQSTAGPNGINFSPDEKTLYVSYSTSGSIAKFSVAADGSLSNKTAFATALAPDSMCVDAEGNLYVAVLLGLSIYDPAGKTLGTIPIGGDVVTNCAFGGTDQKTLFITSHSLLSPAQNSSSISMIEGMPIPGIPGRN